MKSLVAIERMTVPGEIDLPGKQQPQKVLMVKDITGHCYTTHLSSIRRKPHD